MTRRAVTSGKRTALVGAVAAAVVLVATACYPPSQLPTGQTIPPGGRVVATSDVLTVLTIATASDDLSKIVYSRMPFEYNLAPHYRYWVYDDDTGTTDELFVGMGDREQVAMSPDGRYVVYSSNDPDLQVGPTAVNCTRGGDFYAPLTYHYCHELYLYDLDTGETRQLTGLAGSSGRVNTGMSFTDDGSAIDFVAIGPNQWGGPPAQFLHLDLATGEITETSGPPSNTGPWELDSRRVAWDSSTGTLTSEDLGTGDVTTLWSDSRVFGLEDVIDDGAYVVLSYWVNDAAQIFRLVDTATGAVKDIPSRWVSSGATRFAVAQQNVAPEGYDRLIIAPILN